MYQVRGHPSGSAVEMFCRLKSGRSGAQEGCRALIGPAPLTTVIQESIRQEATPDSRQYLLLKAEAP